MEYGANAAATRNGLDDSIIIHNHINHHPPSACTNKALGGTSATWGGRCVMYDEVDFVDRPAFGGECTWDRSFLMATEPYVNAAQEYFECAGGGFRLADAAAHRPIAEGFRAGDVTDNVIERWSRPTRFGRRYRAAIDRAANLTLVDGVEARRFREPDEHGCVRELQARDVRTGAPIRVVAAQFVLAAGAQESTRLLLRSPEMFRALGGLPDSLGRYYQGHVSGKIAFVRFRGDPRKTDYFFGREANGVFFRRRFQLSREAIIRGNLLNASLWLDNPPCYDATHGNGALSFMYLMMITPWLGPRLAPPALAQMLTNGRADKVRSHLGNVIRGLPGSLSGPAGLFVRRYCLPRRLPGIFLYNADNKYALHFVGEQAPSRENRMMLSPDGETLEICYHVNDADIASVLKTHELLDEWLRRCGCGELIYMVPKEARVESIRRMSRDGIHQVGTTRIAATPSRGVVDADLRVWGTKNVYVCSSSVFPTSGQANPTFFLGVCAVRLARTLVSNNENG